MKAIKTLSAAAVLFFAASCSKSGNDVQPPSSSVKKTVKEIVYTDPDGTVESQKVTYDGQGRIQTYISGSRTYDFLYESSTSLKATRQQQGIIDQEVACTMNEKGAITKMEFADMPAHVVTYVYELTYDANGYVTKVKGYYPGGEPYEEVFQIQNGNSVSSKLYRGGVLKYNREYTYDLSRQNKTYFSTWNFWPSETMFGKTAKNMIIGNKGLDVNGQLDWHSKFTYQYDADGYPVKLVTDYIHEGTQSTAEYKYQ